MSLLGFAEAQVLNVNGTTYTVSGGQNNYQYVSVENSGTLVLNNGTIYSPGGVVIGQDSFGALIINGGFLSASNLRVGRAQYGSAAGRVRQMGGEVLLSPSGLEIGRFSNYGSVGEYSLEGGLLTTPDVLIGGRSSGSLFYISGGTVATSSFSREIGTGDSTLYLDGGVIKATASNANFIPNGIATRVAGGTTTFDLNGFSIAINQPMEHWGAAAIDGGIRIVGSGSLTFSSPSIYGYTGTTTIAGGTLRVGGSLVASTVNAAGGTIQFLTQTSGTIGGLAGSQDITLTGTNGTGIALNVGGNNQSTIYSGGLSGNGSLTKTGSGTLTLSGNNTHTGGTIVDAGTLLIDRIENSLVRSGILSVNAAGSVRHTGPMTIIGFTSGDNAAMLINGGSVSTTAGIVGHEAGSIGSVTVTGGTWTNLATLEVGGSGAGSLFINGGLVSNTAVDIGGRAGGFGLASVTSGTWINSGNIDLGFSGTGHLDISGNSLVTGTSGHIGRQVGSTGSATISSGTWATSGDLSVGNGGVGSLLVNGGLVSVSGTAFTGVQNSGSGSLQLQSGTFSAMRLVEGGGSGKISFNGGVLQARADESDFLSGYDAGDVTIDAGGAFLDSNGYSIAISTTLSGTGRLTKVGSGTLALSGASSYEGGTTVSGGMFIAHHDHAVGTGAVTVEDGIFHIGAGVDVDNAVVLAGGFFSRAVTGALSGAVDATSDLGGTDTTARILAGTTEGTTLVTSFSVDEEVFSDVYHLTGTGQTAFVLELCFASLESGFLLGWWDGDEWANAVGGNDDNTATGGMLGFVGTFADFQFLHGLDLAGYMGAYGSETVDGITSVWAVLNHNSAFAAIPEPSTLMLVPASLLLLVRRRR